MPSQQPLLREYQPYEPLSIGATLQSGILGNASCPSLETARFTLAPECAQLISAERRIGTIHIQLKRAYEKPSPEDGTRILVDRLWPRGLSKKTAAIDQWRKEIAPSTELRKWFAHDPDRWKEFQRRYTAELRVRDQELRELRSMARRSQITLVYAARDVLHNDAVVIRDVLIRGSARN